MGRCQVLKGKGLWAYRLWELDLALQLAPNMGINYILYKVGQGVGNGKEGYYIDSAAALAQKIFRAGLTPLAWVFSTLGDPEFEAQMAAKALADGYQGFVFNVEDAARGRESAARTLAQRVPQLGVNPQQLYLCSYPTPLTLHSDLPYNILGPLCQGGLMPMAYGSYQRPPEIVIDRWTYQEERRWMQQQGLTLPIYPVLAPYYDELGARRMSREELQIWLDRLAVYRPSFFSLFTAATIEADYFSPVRGFPLGEPEDFAGMGWIRTLWGTVIYGEPGGTGSRLGTVPYRSQATATGARTVLADNSAWIAVRTTQFAGWIVESAFQPADPGAWPVLPPAAEAVPGQVKTVWALNELNLRSEPRIAAETLNGRVPLGTRLAVVEDPVGAARKIGQTGQWVKVRVEPESFEAWAAAWYLTDRDPNPTGAEGIQLEVFSPEAGYLNIREQPSSRASLVGQVPHQAALTALESTGEIQRKVGQTGQWIHVRLSDGKEGYAAAWYLKWPALADPAAVHIVKVNSPEQPLRLRQGAGTNFPAISQLVHGTALESLDEPAVTAARVGKQGAWLHVRTPARQEGYVAAWYLKLPEAADLRQPVTDRLLPAGESAYLFGMHAGSLIQEPAVREPLRKLFLDQGRGGWVLFSQAVGSDPAAVQPDPVLREQLWEWSDQCYGMVIQLRYGEPPLGTLPESNQYEGFADAAARWVELFLKRSGADRYTWMVQIGRAPNDLNEHPGGPLAAREHIMPQSYAAAFNLAYARIKAVAPAVQVLAAAPDPYQADFLPLLGNRRYKPLVYFQEMLAALQATDGFALEVGTHSPMPESITHLLSFADPFLSDHYYDFQAYRALMEQIPLKWKNLPVLITAARLLDPTPGGTGAGGIEPAWPNVNRGWVRAAYEEIQRWNAMPYAQQILGLLLYRWSGDRWALVDKPAVLEDFKLALVQDQRWRR